ncbi:MAG: aminotransferase class I/II-fold pyridoxal phosphate-dependent enzyme [Acidobacteria bacterium]|nr:MAG: aminotransferase class I/II-fold pyridoxal phosphate-dependent enzyme [Acidobacteriota bacterium]
MTDPATAGAGAINRDLEQHAPAIYRCLSPLGRRLFYPPGIPQQAAEARGVTYNGTIGQITDGHGGALPLPALADLLHLAGHDRDRAFLYSPVDGIGELRRAWRARQRRGVEAGRPSSLPLVTIGLTHALSMAADLFGGDGRPVAIPAPLWGNYRQTFALRTGAEILSAPAVVEGRFNPHAVAQALDGVAPGEPALVVLNAPSNPYGYMPDAGERRALVDSLLHLADRRPLVVLCDDAYAGLVYGDVPATSLFWDLTGVHPDLLAVKIDGVTKELSFFGGRVGFLTFGVEQGSAVEAALASKVKSLIRSTVGSPVAATQMMVLKALRDPRVERQIDAVRRRIAARHRVLQEALATTDPALLKPWPSNAGLFTLLELPAGVDPETLRRHLLAHHDAGLVSVRPRFIRIAFCSVAQDALPELVRRLERGVRELL